MEEQLQAIIPGILEAPNLAYLRTSKGGAYYYVENGLCVGLHLRACDLADHHLKNILEIVQQGKHLRVLHLAENRLKNLRLNLPMIEYLELSSNSQLRSLKLEHTPKLQKLVANDCALNDVTMLTGGLELQSIELARNQITELHLPSSLPQLRFLDVSENQLINLNQPAIEACVKRENFYLWAVNNPFEDVILSDIFKLRDDEEKRKQLLVYWAGDKITVQRVKLIFLGNTQAGKTTLADILTSDSKADGSSTEGINVFWYDGLQRNNQPIEVQGFDFGGQDYYHNTHISFFERNALYVLVWGKGQPDQYAWVEAKRGGEDFIYPLNYWLGSIPQLLGLDAKASLKDEYERNGIELHLLQNPDKKQEVPEELNNRALKNKYGVKAFETFCLPKEQKKAKAWLDKTIVNYARTTEIRKQSYDLAKSIKQEKEKVIIGFDHSSLNELTDVQTEVKFLHSILACHYTEPTEDRKLSDEQKKALASNLVIDMEEFTNWIYKILTIKELKENNKGYFTTEQAKEWLDASAKVHFDYLLGFMLYYKIIFKVAGKTDMYVVPNYVEDKLLITEQLFLSTFEAPLVKYYFTGFYHANIMTEIIFTCYDDLLQDTLHLKYVLWKNKVILYEKEEDKPEDSFENKRLLYLDFSQKQHPLHSTEEVPTIELRRFSNLYVSDEYFQKVMGYIEKVIEKFEYLKYVITPQKSYIPFDCLEQQNQLAEDKKETYLVHYQNQFYRKGDFKLFLKNYSLPMKKIFISYSKSDEKYKDEFKKHLVTLREQNLIDTFDDRELELGAKWDNTLQQKIDECDILVCLVSVDFLNTKYIRDVEIPRAIENGKVIVPIIIKPCDWEGTILGTYNAANKAKVISLFGQNPDNEPEKFRSASKEERDFWWLEIVKKFKEILK